MRIAALVAVMIGLLIGLAVGFGGYTFLYAKGASCLTNDPDACRNYHIMQ
jgi:cytochrome c nitrite reductase small subunit